VYPNPNTGGFYLTFLRKPSREQKFFAKTFVKTKIFAKTFAKAKIFAKQKFREISRKVSEFSLIFAFRENENRGFRFNPSGKSMRENLNSSIDLVKTVNGFQKW
jgi:hypothetical protein